MSFIASLFYRAALSEENLKAPVEKASRSRTRSRRSPASSQDDVATFLAGTLDAEDPEASADEKASRSFREKVQIIDQIIAEDNLYKVLGVTRLAKTEDIRRAFLTRSRSCHPDKFPDYPPSTVAFQKLAFAYETLSKPASRQAYEFAPTSHTLFKDRASQTAFEDEFGEAFADATLQDVLFTVYVEFFEGDFTSVKALLKVLADSGLGTYNDANIRSIESKFRKLSQLMRATRRYSRVLLNEMSRLYEIQQDLRGLSYFDIPGRLRLTLQLARVTLSIPLAIDQAMQNPEDYDRKEFGQWIDDSHRKPAGRSSDSSDSEQRSDSRSFGVRSKADAHIPGSDDPARQRYQRARNARVARRAKQRRTSRNDASSRNNIEASSADDDEDAESKNGFLGHTTTALFTGMIGLLEAGEGWVGGKPTIPTT